MPTRFQSTPPRRGDRNAISATSRLARVSIHAPAKGRPTAAAVRLAHRQRFNPRPREGATTCRRSRRAGRDRFQSTPPRRGRRRRGSAATSTTSVSIHAPAQGATSRHRVLARSISSVSIHAPAKGATVAGQVPSLDRPEQFQSTPPRRGDVRACRGDRLPHAVSIHAPAKGATSLIAVDLVMPYAVSIHAPARGRPARPRRSPA